MSSQETAEQNGCRHAVHMASVVSSTFLARRRLIRDLRHHSRYMNRTLAKHILITLFCFAGVGFASDQPTSLQGRWRADTVPTGYWIIDRFADGRYAEKAFLSYDYSKPSEIVITWGRWKVQSKKYLSIIDGSTSSFVRKFVGKWKATDILTLDKFRFVFMSSDQHDRTEKPLADTTNLVELSLKAPPDLKGPNLTVIKPDVKNVPDWVGSPKTP